MRKVGIFFKQYSCALILSLTIIIGELHKFWHGGNELHNWIWRAYRPMTTDWNIKYAADQLIIILYFVAWLLYVPNKVNKRIVGAFLCLAIMDTIMYFYNYKTDEFGKVYYWFAFFYFLMTYGKRFLNWIYTTLHPK